jgi:GH25 family lysozyme M1 (1,4-beta-N-acetylmuramidase)
LGRVRDAAISFALTKAIDTVDDMFPGFRDHYERT